jgi:hypothetical protein
MERIIRSRPRGQVQEQVQASALPPQVQSERAPQHAASAGVFSPRRPLPTSGLPQQRAPDAVARAAAPTARWWPPPARVAQPGRDRAPGS